MRGDAPPWRATPAARAHAVRRVLYVTLLLNLAVAAAKLAAGAPTHTLSMIADGYHSLMDGAGNAVGLFALAAAHRPPDHDHQYGHRKFEVLASIGISVMLFVTAGEILLSAWGRLRGTGDAAIFSTVSVAIMAATMVVNLGVSRYEWRRGRELHSPFLQADSRHTSSDLYASASVLAALVGIRLGMAWIDSIAAILIAVVIVSAGYRSSDGAWGSWRTVPPSTRGRSSASCSSCLRSDPPSGCARVGSPMPRSWI